MARKLVLTIDMPGKKGDYELELPPNFTMREERILVQMAGAVSGEWVAALEKGSLGVMFATACVAMRRAGVDVDPRAFEDLSPEALSVRFVEDPDEAPLADPPANENNESTSQNGERSSTPSGPTPENTSPPGIGAPALP